MPKIIPTPVKAKAKHMLMRGCTVREVFDALNAKKSKTISHGTIQKISLLVRNTLESTSKGPVAVKAQGIPLSADSGCPVCASFGGTCQYCIIDALHDGGIGCAACYRVGFLLRGHGTVPVQKAPFGNGAVSHSQQQHH